MFCFVIPCLHTFLLFKSSISLDFSPVFVFSGEDSVYQNSVFQTCLFVITAMSLLNIFEILYPKVSDAYDWICFHLHWWVLKWHHVINPGFVWQEERNMINYMSPGFSSSCDKGKEVEIRALGLMMQATWENHTTWVLSPQCGSLSLFYLPSPASSLSFCLFTVPD